MSRYEINYFTTEYSGTSFIVAGPSHRQNEIKEYKDSLNSYDINIEDDTVIAKNKINGSVLVLGMLPKDIEKSIFSANDINLEATVYEKYWGELDVVHLSAVVKKDTVNIEYIVKENEAPLKYSFNRLDEIILNFFLQTVARQKLILYKTENEDVHIFMPQDN